MDDYKKTIPIQPIHAHGTSKLYVLKTELSQDYLLERAKGTNVASPPTIDLTSPRRERDALHQDLPNTMDVTHTHTSRE